MGIDVYPTSLNKAYDILESYAAAHKLYPRKEEQLVTIGIGSRDYSTNNKEKLSLQVSTVALRKI